MTEPGPLPILVIARVDLRAPQHGLLMRLETAVEALGELGPVEVAVVRPRSPGQNQVLGPLPPSVRRSAVFEYSRRLTAWRRMAWFVRPSAPLSVVGRHDREMRRELASWMSPTYALVWVVGALEYHVVEPVLPACPVVVDFNDLESDKLAAEMASRGWNVSSIRSRVRAVLAAQQARRNVTAWRRFEQHIVRAVSRSVVCSDADRLTLAAESVAVVPNGYRTPPVPLGRLVVGDPPTLLLQGSLTYPPNRDAARFFVREVLPLVRRQIPGVRLRIVGRTDDEVLRLAEGDVVVVTGYVPQIDVELRKADVVVVPIRYGGGTRIKIIEALAHGIPVVSTRMGAFGLGVLDGEQVLLADDPADFAASCVLALTDSALRQRLARSGRLFFEDNLRQEAVKDQIKALVKPFITPSRALSRRERPA